VGRYSIGCVPGNGARGTKITPLVDLLVISDTQLGQKVALKWEGDVEIGRPCGGQDCGKSG
jgi:hypothetical protein